MGTYFVFKYGSEDLRQRYLGRHQVALAQLLGAVLVHEVGPHQRLHRRGGGHRERAARHLLREEAVRHHVGAGAAVRLGVAQPEVAELADALEELGWKLRALVERLRGRNDLGVDEPRDGLAKLFLLCGESDHWSGGREAGLFRGWPEIGATRLRSAVNPRLPSAADSRLRSAVSPVRRRRVAASSTDRSAPVPTTTTPYSPRAASTDT